MFILQPKDVQLCSVIKQGEKLTQKFQSLFYRGYLFIKVASYPHNQFTQAIQECRQLLEEDNSVATIIVKTPHALTLWSHERRLKITKTSPLSGARSPKVINSLLPTKERFDLRQNVKFYQKWDKQSLDFWQEIARIHFDNNK